MMSNVGEIQIEKSAQESFLRLVRGGSWIVFAVAVLFQLIVYPDITNFVAILAIAFAWLIATNIWVQAKMLNNYLLSSFTMLGFVANQFYLPLLFTSLENKPVIYNLDMPEEVFMHSTLTLLALTAAHAFYRFLMDITPSKPASILEKAGFFIPPSHLQLWIMGMIGMLSSFYVYFVSPDVGREVTGAASDKLVQALVPFTYAPFFIPFSKLFGSNEKPIRGFLPLLLLYGAVLLAISLGRNSRGAFIIGLTNPAFAWILGLMMAVFSTRVFTVKNFLIGGLVLWFLIGPLSDLGTAMVIVRGDRNDIPPSELIMETIDAFGDKEAIEARRKDDVTDVVDWDEHYLDNIYTARFANIKFNDSNLITYSKVGEYDPDMQAFSLDQLLAVFPDPVLQLFDFDIDKDLVLSMSFGDFLYVLSGGIGTPEAFRVGHYAGTGMATFGWWYLLLFAIVVVPIFYLNDKFFRPRKLPNESTDNATVKLSFCAVLALTGYFQFLWFESVVNGATFLIRGWIQVVILYYIIFHLTRAVAWVFTRRKRTFLPGNTSHQHI